LGRFLYQKKDGTLALNQKRIASEERFDGKFLLLTSDDTLSAEDVALGYKQLSEVESSFLELKQTIELRPIFHRKEDRIRAHLVLCWLALLLVRVAEVETSKTWSSLRAELQRMHLGVFSGSAGRVLQRTETTPPQKAIFSALKIKEPPLLFGFDASP
jgi:transposase